MRSVLLTSPTGPLPHALTASFTLAGVQTSVLATRSRTPGLSRWADAHEERLVAEAMAPFDVVIDTRPPPAGGGSGFALAREYARGTRHIVTAAAMAGTSRLILVHPLRRPREQRWLWQAVDDLAVAASPHLQSLARVGVAPVFGPEPGVTTDLNALIARVISGRLPAVARAVTNVLSAIEAAEAIVHTAWNRNVDHLTLPGTQHTYKQIADIVAELAGMSKPFAAPKVLATILARLADVPAPWRGPRLVLPPCRFAGYGHRQPVTTGLAQRVLYENLAATVAYFRGTVQNVAPNR